ncbi:SMI1/KNR4 family protein [Photobacterium kishitanii]|uniref:SMI1/KNR4 family protein n=1 Tax=Photobacterium kishitanii TaxID=318456 RepID=UPI000D15ACDE|nr:SMI1/KNR4 family protein [Photobacterium kishitanii]PSU92020.1 SMI1/KNR4 family protein [Photobacterium kishitanii]
MNKLATEIERSLPEKMYLPDEIRKLLVWIENTGSVEEYDGKNYGTLPGELNSNTYIEFYSELETKLWWCFDCKEAQIDEIDKRIFIFARTGCDGSVAAFWLDDNGIQRIVHIGSASGSAMICVLGNDPLDFIKLLAIGYEEICWGEEEYNNPPNNPEITNEEYKQWVEESFNTKIPSTGAEIIQDPAVTWDLESNDLFCRWLSKYNKEDF